MLNNRQETTIIELINSSKCITADYLAELFSVTKRTIRSDLSLLNDILKDNGALIRRDESKIIRMIITDDQQFKKYIDTIINVSDAIPVEPEDRIQHLIRKFLLSNDYIKIDDLAEELIVSRSTLQKDLKDVKVILNKFNLVFEKRPNYGVKLVGNERNIRNAMSELLFKRNTVFHADYSNQDWLLDKNEIQIIQKIILKKLKHFNLNLSDIALNNLVVHIAIACKRIQNQQYAQLTNIDNSDIIKKEEYEVAKSIIHDIETKLNYSFPEVEITYVTMHLLGTKLFLDNEKTQPLSAFDQEIVDVVDRVIKTVDRRLALRVSDDKELYAGITIHLKPAIHRFKHNMNIRNPMLDAIKINYPLAFEASVLASKIIEDSFKIKMNEDEMGYIALHFGAAIERAKLKVKPLRTLIVCTTGVGSSQLLLYKIKASFSNRLSIIGATELHNLVNFSEEELDLIISTVPLPKEVTVPHVVVGDILGDTDLNTIQALIDTQEVIIIDRYLDKELIYPKLELETPEQVIRYLSHELLMKNKLKEDISESVLSREKTAATSFGNLVAVPHPLLPTSEETFWTIATLKQPIDWNNKKVQFVCLLNVAKEVTQSLEPMYKMLLSLIDNPEMIHRLIKCETKDEIYSLLKRI